MSEKLPFSPADILLPKGDMHKWSTIACDQFTSQNEYWEHVREEAGDAPSCYNLTLPEIYLGEPDCDRRIEKINKTMREYLEKNIFEEYDNALILVERRVSGGKCRRGLIGKFSLDDYNYESGSKPLIRPTEGTVVSRIPARVEIRAGAALELPHIMILMDDKQKSIIETIDTENQKLLYDFELMLGGGNIKAWLLSDEERENVLMKLQKQAENCRRESKMLFAVGDGNHSLAAAKAGAERIGTDGARYALAELVNVHNEGVEFEPIYRVVFNVDTKDFMNCILKSFDGACGRKVEYISREASGSFFVDGLEADVLQKAIDSYINAHPGSTVDYIHGEEAVRQLADEDRAVGFIFGGMTKGELFDYVNENGPLPRKTFSIGQAVDKRYYLEARKIND